MFFVNFKAQNALIFVYSFKLGYL